MIFCVQFEKEIGKIPLEYFRLRLIGDSPSERLFKDGVCVRFVGDGIDVLHGDIACRRAHFDEVLQSAFNRFFQVVKARNFARQSFQLRHERLVGRRFHAHELVRAEGGDNLELIPLFRNFGEDGQIVENLVRREQMGNVRPLDQLLRRDIIDGDILVAPVPNLLRILLVDFQLAVEKVLQFHLRPVVQGIAERRAERLAIRQKFFLVARVARDILFIYAEVAHQTPFVVIPAQPDFIDIGKGFVFENLLFGQVTMIVENGHIFRVVVIQLICRLVGE